MLPVKVAELDTICVADSMDTAGFEPYSALAVELINKMEQES
jgi:hypothetical protein